MQNRTQWIAAFAVALVALLAPALLNGFPLVYSDTGGYLARPFEGKLILGRSALYGAFLAAGIPLQFWSNVAFQAGVTVWLLYTVLRTSGCGGPTKFTFVVAALAILTSLPWYVSQLIPDIFVLLSILAVHLLAFSSSQLRKKDIVLLIVVIVFGMASHMSIVALVLALLLVFLTLRLIGSRVGLPRPRLAAPVMAAVSGVIVALLSNFAIAG